MADCMTFPEDWHDFLKDYSFDDSKEVYTNGSRLISVFRVEQLIEHLLETQEPCEDAVSRKMALEVIEAVNSLTWSQSGKVLCGKIFSQIKDLPSVLPESMARVLTMEEAQAIKAPGTLMWLEASGGYDGCRYKAIPVIISGNTHGILPEDAMHFYNTADRAWSAYNREICGWRLWTNEPSDEVRVMTSWN